MCDGYCELCNVMRCGQYTGSELCITWNRIIYSILADIILATLCTQRYLPGTVWVVPFLLAIFQQHYHYTIMTELI